ncbi:rCG51293 [Rattus norvegicus]|uniref:RCG51293 n=1 Tax=Rattus norvegicus TaxID=10116 RepID=A6IY77_RAT|nr:rCG51293 [Rattus norvegicus]
MYLSAETGEGVGGQRRETRLKEEQREGTLRGSTPNPLVLYI